MLVLGHVHALAAEAHAFEFQACALREARFEFELNLPAGAHHPLPRQRIALAPQQLRHVTVIQRVAGGGREERRLNSILFT